MWCGVGVWWSRIGFGRDMVCNGAVVCAVM